MDSPGLAHQTTRAGSDLRSWVIWIVCAAAMCALRAWAFDLPLETDESNYAYIGGRLIVGDRLYVDVWDHQPPGVFMLFAAAEWAFGASPIVFRMLAMAASLVSLAMVAHLARRVGGVLAGGVACVLFALASSDPGTAGEGCNRELFMTPLILAAWALLLSPRRSGTKLLWAGTLLGAASVLKTVVAAHWLAGAIWLLTSASGVRRPDRSPATPRSDAKGGRAEIQSKARIDPSRGQRLLLFGAGPALLWAFTWLWFLATHRGGEFIDAVFRFNLDYSAARESVFVRFAQFFQPKRHPYLFDSAAAVWCGGAVGVIYLAARALGFGKSCTVDSGSADRRSTSLAMIALVVASYAAVCMPVRFWPHYYYLMLAPLTVVAAIACAAAAQGIASAAAEARWDRTLAAKFVMLILPVWLAWTVARDYLLESPLDLVWKSPLDITLNRYNSRDFWAQAHGLKARSVTDPDDAIFMFGNDAGVYYYSGRRCASRFTMMMALDPAYADAPRRQRQLMEDLRRDPPRLILIADAKPFPEWERFVRENYELVGMDHHDHRPEEVILLVFADRRRPVRAIDWEWDRSAVAAGADSQPP